VSGPETPRVQSLCEWLQIATAKLSTPAKERIRLEIEAHSADSVESHQAAGCSEAEARLAALAELGDPYAAAKRFRRRHLTEKEEKKVREVLELSGGRHWLLLAYFVDAFFYFFLHALKPYHAPLVFGTVAVFVCVGLQTIGFFVARRNGSKPDIRLLVLIHVLLDAFFMLLGVCLGIGRLWGLGLAISIGPIVSLVPDLRLWFKLGQVDGFWPETTSRV